ncbi:hypothetical protein [Streptomyces sp. DH20]|uniref:hypothetical protein n=1 Tax=Streptomyces sp. DH20 TaxID=2857009 RepID=UPI001E339EC3|nr:hypothetical protein [Streptomyces sp. DH20]
MNQNLMDDYHALASSISPSEVSRYLHAQGWEMIDRREGLLEEWAEPAIIGSESESEVHLLPVNQEYRDFQRRFVEFLVAVAAYYEIDAYELSHRLRLGASDVLLFRVCHDDAVDDVVSIDEANDVLSVMRRIISVSARYTASPNKGFTGRMPPQAKEYLAQHVSLGHTRPGSFVFPFISGPRILQGAKTVFARRVMENLAIALDRVRSLPVSQHAVLDELSPLVVALAGSLQKLARSPAFSSIEISFMWAPGREASDEVPVRPIALQPDEIREIGISGVRAKQYLQDRNIHDYRLAASRGPVVVPRVPAIPEVPSVVDTEITGEIIALNIDDRRISDWGSRYSIVIRSDVRDSVIDVEMPVEEAEFTAAAEARNHGAAVTAVGTLVRTMGGFTMRGRLNFNGQQQSR